MKKEADIIINNQADDDCKYDWFLAPVSTVFSIQASKNNICNICNICSQHNFPLQMQNTSTGASSGVAFTKCPLRARISSESRLPWETVQVPGTAQPGECVESFGIKGQQQWHMTGSSRVRVWTQSSPTQAEPTTCWCWDV